MKSFIFFTAKVEWYLSGGRQATQKPARMFVHFSTELRGGFLHARSTKFHGHVLPSFYIRFVKRQDLALRNCAMDAPS